MTATDRQILLAMARLRCMAGLTQRQVGVAMGIPEGSAQGSISRLELGIVGMRLHVLTAYLAACGASLADLADEAETMRAELRDAVEVTP